MDNMRKYLYTLYIICIIARSLSRDYTFLLGSDSEHEGLCACLLLWPRGLIHGAFTLQRTNYASAPGGGLLDRRVFSCLCPGPQQIIIKLSELYRKQNI